MGFPLDLTGDKKNTDETYYIQTIQEVKFLSVKIWHFFSSYL